MTATLPYHDAPLTAEQRLQIIADLNAIREMTRVMEVNIRRSAPPHGFDAFRNDFAQVIDRLALAFPLPIGEPCDESV